MRETARTGAPINPGDEHRLQQVTRWEWPGDIRWVYSILVMCLAGCMGDRPHREDPEGDFPWRLGSQPIVVIGDDVSDADRLFYRVGFVELVNDDRLVVINRSDPAIRVFDLNGNLLRRFGAMGEGPAEIRWGVNGAWVVPPDTLRVVDGREGIKTFLLDGSFEGQTQFDEGVWAEVLAGVFDDGSMVFVGVGGYPEEPTEGELIRERPGYQHVGPDGQYHGILIWGFHRITYPYGPTGVNRQHSLGPHSSELIRDDTLFIAEGLRPEVALVTKEGEVARVIPVPGHEMSYEEARDSLRVALEKSGNESRIERLEMAPALDSVPQVAGMLMDDEGLLWVKRFDPAKDSNAMLIRQYLMDPHGGEWWIMDREGTLRGTMSLPDRFVPMDISKSLIAGITVDEFEVERVVVYRIENRE